MFKLVKKLDLKSSGCNDLTGSSPVSRTNKSAASVKGMPVRSRPQAPNKQHKPLLQPVKAKVGGYDKGNTFTLIYT